MRRVRCRTADEADAADAAFKDAVFKGRFASTRIGQLGGQGAAVSCELGAAGRVADWRPRAFVTFAIRCLP